MKLPSEASLYKTIIFLLALMVVLGMLFDTNYH